MTVFRLKTDPVSGNVAIYSVPSHASTDNTPLMSPYTDPSRLQYHSGMVCPSTTPALTQQVTVTIPTQGTHAKYDGTFNLFAHGKGQPCMVEGRVWDPDAPSNAYAFNGTMPVKVNATGHATWLYLGASSTHVVLGYFGITAAGFSAFNVTVEASAYDFLASGAADTSNPALPILTHALNSYLQLGRGKVDTRRRYLRRVTSGADFALATGPTLSIVGSGLTLRAGGSYVQNELGWRWRYSCAGYVKQTTEGWNGASTNGGSHNADYVLVKR